ncbi:Ribonuclease Z [Minicystis rosea]|nr:Ribonuclease Z [Minicystis rosea]
MSTLGLTFLGTSAAVPTAGRNLSGLFLKRGADAFLFDCGEGTQRQMVRFGTGFSLTAIFFTHFHADHYLGVIGMLRTFAMQAVPRPLSGLHRVGDAREESAAKAPVPLRLYGPRPAASLLPRMIKLGIEELAYPIEIVELEPGAAFQGDGYRIEAFATQHRVPSVGYALIEEDRPGRFDLARAEAMGVPRGPSFGQLQRGEPITLPDGRVVRPEEVLGPARAGRRIVVSGDTRPCDATIAAAERADVLVHESTFGDDESERAVGTAHSTAREAACVGREAGARRVVLTHLSSRYDMDAGTLLRQAQSELPSCEIANDGYSFEVPYRD